MCGTLCRAPIGRAGSWSEALRGSGDKPSPETSCFRPAPLSGSPGTPGFPAHRQRELSRCGRKPYCEPGVVDHETEVPLVRLHLTKVLGPYGAACDGQFVHLPSAVVSDCQGLALAIISGRPRLFVCLHAHLLILRQRATGCFG